MVAETYSPCSVSSRWYGIPRVSNTRAALNSFHHDVLSRIKRQEFIDSFFNHFFIHTKSVENVV